MPALSDAEVFGGGPAPLTDEQVFGSGNKPLSDAEVFGSTSPTPETDKAVSDPYIRDILNAPSPETYATPERQAAISKFINTPLVSPEVIQSQYELNPFTGPPIALAKLVAPNIVAGAERGVSSAVAGLTTPTNIAMLPIGGVGGKLGRVVLGAAFEAQAIQHAPERYGEMRQAFEKGDYAKGVEDLIGLGTEVGLPAVIAFHPAPKSAEQAARTAPEEAPATVIPPEAQTRPVEAAPTPETPITTETQRITPEEVTQNAEQPSNAQVEGGNAPLGVETRPEGNVPRPSDSDNVIGGAQGESAGELPQEPVVAPAPPQEAQSVTAGEATPPAPKPSKIGQSIEAKAVEAKLTEGFAQTALYDPITIADQAQRATQLVESSPDTARAIIRGDEPLPEGLRGTSLITAMEERLLDKPDPQTAYELANSPLTSATSAAAQEMRLMAERVPDSITAKFEEIRRAREAGSRQRGDTPEKLAMEVQREIVKNSSKRPTWEAFVREITCA